MADAIVPATAFARFASPSVAEAEDGTDRRLTVFGDVLRTLPRGRLLDLGTGHGKFALIGQELGFDVTAVDVRTERMPMTPGIRWIQHDVRTFDVQGYDCIALLGLLYHLEYADVGDLLARCSGTVTILDTHTARRVTSVQDGYDGMTFKEIADYTPDRLASTATASWGNPTSWWPTHAALVRILRDVGYRTVLTVDPPLGDDRTFYLCIPAGAAIQV